MIQRIRTLGFNYKIKTERKMNETFVSNIGQRLEHLSSRIYPSRSRLINFEKLIVQVKGPIIFFFLHYLRKSESFVPAIH